jgi:hypothetical protein
MGRYSGEDYTDEYYLKKRINELTEENEELKRKLSALGNKDNKETNEIHKV